MPKELLPILGRDRNLKVPRHLVWTPGDCPVRFDVEELGLRRDHPLALRRVMLAARLVRVLHFA
jgi:hypothetical protein